MSTKSDDHSTGKEAVAPAPLAARTAEILQVFRVRLRLSQPLDYAVSQLHRAWPKPAPRRDN